jgi:hypothetical protein
MNMFTEQDNPKPEAETVRGLNLATVKPTTVQVTKLQLWHYLSKTGLTKDLYVM